MPSQNLFANASAAASSKNPLLQTSFFSLTKQTQSKKSLSLFSSSSAAQQSSLLQAGNALKSLQLSASFSKVTQATATYSSLSKIAIPGFTKGQVAANATQALYSQSYYESLNMVMSAKLDIAASGTGTGMDAVASSLTGFLQQLSGSSFASAAQQQQTQLSLSATASSAAQSVQTLSSSGTQTTVQTSASASSALSALFTQTIQTLQTAQGAATQIQATASLSVSASASAAASVQQTFSGGTASASVTATATAQVNINLSVTQTFSGTTSVAPPPPPPPPPPVQPYSNDPLTYSGAQTAARVQEIMATPLTPTSTVNAAAGQRVLIKNTDTGESAAVSFESNGKIVFDTSPQSTTNVPTQTVNVTNGQTIRVQGANGQALTVNADQGQGMKTDWDIEATQNNAEIFLKSSTGFNSSRANLVRTDTGAAISMGYYNAHSDTFATSSGSYEEVVTIRMRSGQSVVDNGYSPTTTTADSNTGGWEISKEGNTSSSPSFYNNYGTGYVNVQNTVTGKTSSFKMQSDGTMVQLDEPVTGPNVTTYKVGTGDTVHVSMHDYEDYAPGDFTNKRSGAEIRVNATTGKDLTVVGAGSSSHSYPNPSQAPVVSKDIIAEVGQGDVIGIRTYSGNDSTYTDNYYKLQGNNLVQTAEPTSNQSNDVTLYGVRREGYYWNPDELYQNLHVRAAGTTQDLAVFNLQ